MNITCSNYCILTMLALLFSLFLASNILACKDAKPGLLPKTDTKIKPNQTKDNRMENRGNNALESKINTNNFVAARSRMVSNISNEGIKEKLVLDAMLKVPRHFFVDKNLEKYAYDNRPLPIDYSQTISQPYIVAFMSQEAQLNHNSRVLEVGTGSGYQTAILAEICKEVFTIEIIAQLSDKSFRLLQELGYSNIHFKIGDGSEGWAEAGPFDAIIVTAKAESLPKNLLHQLAVGGRMILPWQKTVDKQVLVKVTKITSNDNYTIEDLLDVRFVPLLKSSY